MRAMREYCITDESELIAIANDVLLVCKEREDGGGAAVLALHGDLGAGKTTFMQTFARALGVREQVTSPTFVVMKKYDTTDDTFSTLVHIDAYRIEDIDEMRPLRFGEELEQKGSIIGIEWAEHIADLLPPHTVHLTFTIEGDMRKIILTHGEKN